MKIRNELAIYLQNKVKKLPIIMIRKSIMERVSLLNLKNQQMKLSLVGEVCINLLYLCLL
nr:MAG TPA: hypothetical protein [Caudoviricetes sp.]